MSRDELKSMLDDLLNDAGAAMRAERERPAPFIPAAVAPPGDGTLTDVEQLRELPDEAVVKVLLATPRDHLLTVLSGASAGLRRTILTNLAPDSVKWLQQNLAYFDEPTRALLAEGRTQMLDRANKLVRAGSITRPAPRPAGSTGTPDDDEIERLGGSIAELLDVLHERGPKALGGVVTAGHPLLDEAVKLVAGGVDEAAVTARVAARKSALLAAYARRLEVAAEGALALARGEASDAFRRRLPDIGK